MVLRCQPVIYSKILISGFVLSIFAYALLPFNICEDLKKEALKYSSNDVSNVEMYRTKRKRSTGLKYVLLWTQDYSYLPFKEGQTSFIENNCPQVDCYFTNDRNFFRGSLRKFDAMVFNGIHLNTTDLPRKRHDYQKYIYIMEESASNYPVCKSMYDNFFNWTFTYKLDSDILYPYFEIRNKKDEIVGPKTHMKWIKTRLDYKILNSVTIKWQQKSDAVAWVVSNCGAKNNRNKLVLQIQKSLHKANLSLAKYGGCGNLSCPREKGSECWKLLERKYYFYLSFENSNCEDYVTEKLINPLHHYLIPIVYGGADYRRFMPRGSYLDASKLSPDELVAKMTKIISSLPKYLKYFKWRSEYRYTDATRSTVCGLCTALHNSTMMDTRTSYDQFRRWWLPWYRNECREINLRSKFNKKKSLPHFFYE